MPAWSNRGLESLAHRLHSTRIFAHVRAASPGLTVQDSNTHPFGHGRFQFMHNGSIDNFRYIKRHLQNRLSDAAWEGIEGSTDSEHAFALFIDNIGGPRAEPTPMKLRQALVTTLAQIVELDAACERPGALICNFAVSDGQSTVVSRFAANTNRPEASLYYSAGAQYLFDGKDCDMLPAEGMECRAIMVASEPLTRRTEDWLEIPPNHTITVAPDCSFALNPIRL
jgi:predicted glutamine amidotransferase